MNFPFRLGILKAKPKYAGHYDSKPKYGTRITIVGGNHKSLVEYNSIVRNNTSADMINPTNGERTPIIIGTFRVSY